MKHAYTQIACVCARKLEIEVEMEVKSSDGFGVRKSGTEEGKRKSDNINYLVFFLHSVCCATIEANRTKWNSERL